MWEKNRAWTWFDIHMNVKVLFSKFIYLCSIILYTGLIIESLVKTWLIILGKGLHIICRDIYVFANKLSTARVRTLHSEFINFE